MAAGRRVDAELQRHDVRLTMGGEPTFVSVDDRDGAEWNTAALGTDKRRLATALLWRLRGHYAPSCFVHFGQGKWYPGEQLPRWALSCYWRTDGQPVVARCRPLRRRAGRLRPYGARRRTVHQGARRATRRHRRRTSSPASKTSSTTSGASASCRSTSTRSTLASTTSSNATGCAASSTRGWTRWSATPCRWRAQAATPSPGKPGHGSCEASRLYLIPGDSAMGYRLPLDSLPWVKPEDYPYLARTRPDAAACRPATRDGAAPAGAADALARRRRGGCRPAGASAWRVGGGRLSAPRCASRRVTASSTSSCRRWPNSRTTSLSSPPSRRPPRRSTSASCSKATRRRATRGYGSSRSHRTPASSKSTCSRRQTGTTLVEQTTTLYEEAHQLAADRRRSS